VTTLPLAAVLAVDGGNSKTDVALVAADGSLLASVRGGASNHQAIGIDAAVGVLRSLVRQAAEEAGLALDAPVAAHTSACLAGADLPDEEAELTTLVEAQGWTATAAVVNDTFAVLRAGLDDETSDSHWGIGVVCGTGMNCVGVAPDGRTARFPALGVLSGDWGGGGDLGAAALWWAIRAEDGRGPQTELRSAVPGHFGVARVEDVVLGVHRGRIGHAELGGLTPVLLAVAAAGDDVARAVVRRQAAEVCAFATAAADRLALRELPVPVVLGGSVLAARDPLLTGTIAERLAVELPGAVVRIVDAPPVLGAALLGLDRVGGPAPAAARLRAAMEPDGGRMQTEPICNS
jgi:N-acetylglucosamine kinase-like BadF-type ATPase